MPLPTFPLEGSCRCGAVRFRLDAAPLVEGVCHCRGCQRMSSSAFSSTLICPANAFVVLQGEPVLGGLRDPEQPHFFCASCMTWLFTKPAAFPDIVNVRATLFDDASWFSPFMETFTEAKLPWVSTGAPRSFAAFPPPEQFPEILAAYGKERGAKS